MPLTGFPVVVPIPVLWGDQDLFRHVNNTVPIKWFESSRVAYWELPGVREVIVESHLGPILAQVHCNYRHQLRYPDTIQVVLVCGVWDAPASSLSIRFSATRTTRSRPTGTR